MGNTNSPTIEFVIKFRMKWISRIITQYVTFQDPEKFNGTVCMFNLPEKVPEGTQKKTNVD